MSETPQATSEPRKLPPPLKSSSRVGAATRNNYSPFIEHESDNEKTNSISLFGRKSPSNVQLQEIVIDKEIEEVNQQIKWLESKKTETRSIQTLIGQQFEEN